MTSMCCDLVETRLQTSNSPDERSLSDRMICSRLNHSFSTLTEHSLQVVPVGVLSIPSLPRASCPSGCACAIVQAKIYPGTCRGSGCGRSRCASSARNCSQTRPERLRASIARAGSSTVLGRVASICKTAWKERVIAAWLFVPTAFAASGTIWE